MYFTFRQLVDVVIGIIFVLKTIDNLQLPFDYIFCFLLFENQGFQRGVGGRVLITKISYCALLFVLIVAGLEALLHPTYINFAVTIIPE